MFFLFIFMSKNADVLYWSSASRVFCWLRVRRSLERDGIEQLARRNWLLHTRSRSLFVTKLCSSTYLTTIKWTHANECREIDTDIFSVSQGWSNQSALSCSTSSFVQAKNPSLEIFMHSSVWIHVFLRGETDPYKKCTTDAYQSIGWVRSIMARPDPLYWTSWVDPEDRIH